MATRCNRAAAGAVITLPLVPITTRKFDAGAPLDVVPITLPKLYSAIVPARPAVFALNTSLCSCSLYRTL